MCKNYKHIPDAIGNTSIVQLRNVVPPTCAKIYVNLEWETPTGSVKDCTAQAMIAKAEEDDTYAIKRKMCVKEWSSTK